jgi:hypothetical protein
VQGPIVHVWIGMAVKKWREYKVHRIVLLMVPRYVIYFVETGARF